MNTTTILDLIATREAATSAARDELREQQAKLAAEVAAIEPSWPTWLPPAKP